MINTLRNPRMQRPKDSGFTLIELLVVIAIIMLLGAILFPVFARARENGRLASCRSNLKQLAVGMMQYTQDNDGRYTLVVQGQDLVASPHAYNTHPAQGWAELIQPYIKSTQILQCPSGTTPQDITVGPINVPAPAAGYSDYWYNRVIGGITGNLSEGDVAPLIPRHEASLTYASNTILLGGCGSNGSSNSTSGATIQPPTGTPLPELNSVHLDGTSLAFADGHVKWFSKTSPIYGRLTPPSGSNVTFASAP